MDEKGIARYSISIDKAEFREELILNPNLECPVFTTKSFTIRLISEEDSESLFKCYHDTSAVELMNDDNCDFGFYAASQDKMSETIRYWLDLYNKQCFIRFAIADNATGEAVGTIEGFGGETGVLRVDIARAYEKTAYLSEILVFAEDHFHELFGHEYLVTKAVSKAAERRQALMNHEWEYIDTFRGYQDYYRTKTKS